MKGVRRGSQGPDTGTPGEFRRVFIGCSAGLDGELFRTYPSFAGGLARDSKGSLVVWCRL